MDFLSSRELECLAMYYYDGMRHKAIAQMVGLSRRRIGQILDSGRTKLAERGMTPKRMEAVDQPKIHMMDPHAMDRLGPADVRAVW